MDESFHRHYWLRARDAGLAEGAAELLAAQKVAGRTQSLCSLAPHDRLVPLVRTHGIDGHFVRVDGATGPSGGGKAEQMARHLLSLRRRARRSARWSSGTPWTTRWPPRTWAPARCSTPAAHTAGPAWRRPECPWWTALAEAVETAEWAVNTGR